MEPHQEVQVQRLQHLQVPLPLLGHIKAHEKALDHNWSPESVCVWGIILMLPNFHRAQRSSLTLDMLQQNRLTL